MSIVFLCTAVSIIKCVLKVPFVETKLSIGLGTGQVEEIAPDLANVLELSPQSFLVSITRTCFCCALHDLQSLSKSTEPRSDLSLQAGYRIQKCGMRFVLGRSQVGNGRVAWKFGRPFILRVAVVF